MNKTINFNLKLNQNDKRNVEKACSEVNLSIRDLFTAVIKKVSFKKHINIDLDIDPFYSDSNIKYLENLDKDVKQGKAHFSQHDLIENNK